MNEWMNVPIIKYSIKKKQIIIIMPWWFFWVSTIMYIFGLVNEC